MTDTVGSGTSAEALTASGVAWLKNNDPDRAIADFTRAIQIDPKNATAFRYRGAAYVRKREFGKAIADLDQTLMFAPNDAAAYYLRGSAWHQKGSLVQAIFDYDKAIKLDPQNLKAVQARKVAIGGRHAADAEVGRTRLTTAKTVRRWTLAVASLAVISAGIFWWVHVNSQNQIQKTTNAAALFHAEQGALLLKEGDYGRAISEYDAAFSLVPRIFADYAGRGKARYGAHDLDGAIADFGLALQVDPKSADVYVARAKAFEDKGNYEQAVNDYDQSIAIRPGNIEAYLARASLRSVRNEFAGAIADWDYVLQHDPNNQDALSRKTDAIERWVLQKPSDIQAFFARASIRSAARNLNGAIADMGRVLYLDPNNVSAFLVRGNFLWQQGDLGRAAADFNQVLRMDPNNSAAKERVVEALQTFMQRGRSNLQAKQFEQAIVDFDGALRIDSVNSEAGVHLAEAVREILRRGKAALKAKQFDQAISDFSKVIERDPSNAEAYEGRGSAWYLRSYDFDRSIPDLDRAIEIDPNNMNAHYLRAMELSAQPFRPHKGQASLEEIARYFDLAIADWREVLRLSFITTSPIGEIHRDTAMSQIVFNLTQKNRMTGKTSDFESIISEYTIAIDAASNRAGSGAKLISLYVGRGDALRGKRDLERAIQDYTKALTFGAMDPFTKSRAYIARGDAFAFRLEFKNALIDYNAALYLNLSFDPNLRSSDLSAKIQRARACVQDLQHCKITE